MAPYSSYSIIQASGSPRGPKLYRITDVIYTLNAQLISGGVGLCRSRFTFFVGLHLPHLYIRECCNTVLL